MAHGRAELESKELYDFLMQQSAEWGSTFHQRSIAELREAQSKYAQINQSYLATKAAVDKLEAEIKVAEDAPEHFRLAKLAVPVQEKAKWPGIEAKKQEAIKYLDSAIHKQNRQRLQQMKTALFQEEKSYQQAQAEEKELADRGEKILFNTKQAEQYCSWLTNLFITNHYFSSDFVPQQPYSPMVENLLSMLKYFLINFSPEKSLYQVQAEYFATPEAAALWNRCLPNLVSDSPLGWAERIALQAPGGALLPEQLSLLDMQRCVIQMQAHQREEKSAHANLLPVLVVPFSFLQAHALPKNINFVAIINVENDSNKPPRWVVYGREQRIIALCQLSEAESALLRQHCQSRLLHSDLRIEQVEPHLSGLFALSEMVRAYRQFQTIVFPNFLNLKNFRLDITKFCFNPDFKDATPEAASFFARQTGSTVSALDELMFFAYCAELELLDEKANEVFSTGSIPAIFQYVREHSMALWQMVAPIRHATDSALLKWQLPYRAIETGRWGDVSFDFQRIVFNDFKSNCRWSNLESELTQATEETFQKSLLFNFIIQYTSAYKLIFKNINFNLSATDIAFIKKLIAKNVNVYDVQFLNLQGNPVSDPLAMALQPICARNYWCKAQALAVLEKDNAWEIAAASLLRYLAMHTEIFANRQQHKIFLSTLAEMGIEGVTALLDYLNNYSEVALNLFAHSPPRIYGFRGGEPSFSLLKIN